MDTKNTPEQVEIINHMLAFGLTPGTIIFDAYDGRKRQGTVPPVDQWEVSIPFYFGRFEACLQVVKAGKTTDGRPLHLNWHGCYAARVTTPR